jgi:hypothetical protein
MTIGSISLISVPGEFENRYFLNNPDITFFKSVYRKHTNFSKYLKVDKRDDNNIFTDSSESSLQFKINSGGDDLLSKIYLENVLTIEKQSDVDLHICSNLGSNIISSDLNNSLRFDIGSNRGVFRSNSILQEIMGELNNQMILTHNGTNTISPCLELSASNISCKNGNHYQNTTLSGGIRGITLSDADTYTFDTFYIIPEFSFMKDYGLAIPLVSLNNEDMFFNVNYNSKDKLFKGLQSNDTVSIKVNLIKELIQLDIEEKTRFLTNNLTYITESVRDTNQITNTGVSLTGIFTLCKYLIITGYTDPGIFESSNNASEVSESTPQELKFKDLNILIDGSRLYDNNVNKGVFTKININEYFEGCGRDLSTDDNRGQLDSIGFIPFCIEPHNKTQPSGCISNLHSGIKRINIDLTKEDVNTNLNLKIFAFNYNILYINNGRAQIKTN